jgi:hypothetical protein
MHGNIPTTVEAEVQVDDFLDARIIVSFEAGEIDWTAEESVESQAESLLEQSDDIPGDSPRVIEVRDV